MNASGVCVATVVGLKDPEGEARVRVDFPMLPGGPKSAWAALARPYAGADRGIYFMPEVGDEALVAFQDGKFDHPFIVGFLWNGRDRQPDNGIDEHVRRIKTRSGHRIDMDDRAGHRAIVIETAGGNTVDLTDGPVGGRIAITTPAGHGITITDTGITVTSVGTVTVNSVGKVSVNCAEANITAPSAVTVNASALTATAGAMTLNGNVTVNGNLVANGGPVSATGGFVHLTPSGPVPVT